MKTVNIIWFRRDLRLTDHTALFHALQSHLEVLPIFIFDDQILNDLPNDDPRVSFIYPSLKKIHQEFEISFEEILWMYGQRLYQLIR